MPPPPIVVIIPETAFGLSGQPLFDHVGVNTTRGGRGASWELKRRPAFSRQPSNAVRSSALSWAPGASRAVVTVSTREARRRLVASSIPNPNSAASLAGGGKGGEGETGWQDWEERSRKR